MPAAPQATPEFQASFRLRRKLVRRLVKDRPVPQLLQADLASLTASAITSLHSHRGPGPLLRARRSTLCRFAARKRYRIVLAGTPHAEQNDRHLSRHRHTGFPRPYASFRAERPRLERVFAIRISQKHHGACYEQPSCPPATSLRNALGRGIATRLPKARRKAKIRTDLGHTIKSYRVVYRSPERQRGQRSDSGHRHQTPTYLVVPGELS